MSLCAEPNSLDEPLSRENARLRRKLDVAQATIRDLRAALMPQPAIPAAFGLWPRQDQILAILLGASPRYFRDGVAYVETAAREAAVPTLFDLLAMGGAE